MLISVDYNQQNPDTGSTDSGGWLDKQFVLGPQNN